MMVKSWMAMYNHKKFLRRTSFGRDIVGNSRQGSSAGSAALESGVMRGQSNTTTPAGWQQQDYSRQSTESSTTTRQSTTTLRKVRGTLLVTDSAYAREYLRKRSLILALLSVEIKFLITRYNPLSLADKVFPDYKNISASRSQNIT
ncbi:hypothetical protein V5799_003029 [Amblyomma americanum]|uniref:Uncharacterized protein n=1 Tax=Amblyomma americanum TaxID=6943 RepID=A0AAQ4DA50_AMBAM